MTRPIVAVLSSVHPAFDSRIFFKQCRSLARAGYEVELIVPHEASQMRDGVRILGLPVPASRTQRMFRTPFQVYRAALRSGATVCHFHDPELIPIGLLLKLRGRHVIYDVHDNLASDILGHKPYIPALARWPLSIGARIFERLAALIFDRVVAATPAIAAGFAKHNTTLVQNYPILAPGELADDDYERRPPWALFAGMISAARGIREMIEAVALVRGAGSMRLKVAGTFSPASLLQEMSALPGWRNLDFLGQQSREQVDRLMTQCRLGLVLYHPDRSHDQAQPNKLFEYMSMGLPVIASNFPLWRDIVEKTGSGLVVDPLDPHAIAVAIERLLANPREARTMGRNGWEAVRTMFNWDVEAAKLLSLYRTLIPGVVG
jgi:glycosyltransferase involved in cell wall biosynthesis